MISLLMEPRGMVTWRVTNVEAFPFVMLRAPPLSLDVYYLGISNFRQLQFLVAVPVEDRIRSSGILRLLWGK